MKIKHKFFFFYWKKKDLGIDELLKPSQHSKRLVFGGTKIVLKAKRFPLRLHYTRRRLFRRVQNDLRVSFLQRLHFLQPNTNIQIFFVQFQIFILYTNRQSEKIKSKFKKN